MIAAVPISAQRTIFAPKRNSLANNQRTFALIVGGCHAWLSTRIDAKSGIERHLVVCTPHAIWRLYSVQLVILTGVANTKEVYLVRLPLVVDSIAP